VRRVRIGVGRRPFDAPIACPAVTPSLG